MYEIMKEVESVLVERGLPKVMVNTVIVLNELGYLLEIPGGDESSEAGDTQTSPRVFISYETAVAMLHVDFEGYCVATSNLGKLKIGFDRIKREDVLLMLENGNPELSGGVATYLGYGLTVWHVDEYLFFRTEAPSLETLSLPLLQHGHRK